MLTNRHGARRPASLALSLAALLVTTFAFPGPGVAATGARFTISGRALDYAAAPMPGIRVELCTAPRTCVATTTGADGRFVSPLLPPADYRVRFTDPARIFAAGYATTGNTTDRWSAALVVHLTANRTGITGNMLPGTSIYGVVTGPDGAPLLNASVTACGAPDEICGSGRTDSLGRYRATVGEGRFTVRVRASAGGETFDGYIGSFGLTFSRDRAVQLLGQPGATHAASVQLTRAPRASFVTGTRLSSAADEATLPIRVAWAASADPATRSVLRERLDVQAPRTVATLSGAAFRGSLSLPLALGHGYRFDVRSTGATGAGPVVSGLHAGPAFDLLLYQESSASVSYSGTWRTVTDASRSGGRAVASVSMGATASFTFSGRAVAWVSRTGPGTGMAQVYVDGRFAGSIDLSATAAAVRTVVFARSWPQAGTHTIDISETAVGEHPPVEVDAFLVMD